MSSPKRREPPALASWLLDKLLDHYWWQELAGDLEEQFSDNCDNKGLRKAKLIFWFEVFRLIRPHLFKKKLKNNSIMLSYNHLKISYRNLIKNKVFSFVNILGLSVGIASVILISLYVQYETSYDNFFKDSDRIYRTALHRVYPDREMYFGTSPVTMAPTLKENYPQVESVTRLHRLFFNNNITVTLNERNETFNETRFLYADSAFFEVFDHKFLVGNPLNALQEIDAVVLTRETAMKYFGTIDILGRTISANGGDLNVTGVIENIPSNSHIHFDLLGSMFSLPFITNAISSNSWVNPWVYTYVKLKEGISADEFESLFPNMVDQFGGANIAQNNTPDWKAKGHRYDYFLQPIESIHLESNLDVEVEPNSNLSYVYIISAIAAVILIISTINFINLSIARSTERAKEVGIRKVVGSQRGTIINQFLTEAVFICFISAVVAIGIVLLVVPQFNQILNTNLQTAQMLNPVAIGLILAFILLVGIISGLYPALVISGINPAKVLKGNYKSSGKGVWLRNSLITLQFIVSIIMISGSIVISSQMNYLSTKDLGFNKSNLLLIKQSFTLGQDYNAFKNSILQNPNVSAVGGSIYMPGEFHGSNVFEVLNSEASDIRVNTVTVDDDYINTMEFNIIEGRGFEKDFNDSLSIIVNQAALRALGIDKGVGVKLKNFAGNNTGPLPEFTIVGVVSDYNFYSLHSEVAPIAIFNGSTQFIPPVTAVRLNTPDPSTAIQYISQQWEEFNEAEFSYSFIEDDLNMQYESDRKSASVFDIFTIVAIIMSCTGLFGLATYVINQRIKEMSIRKVLGASLPNLIKVFSKEFLLLIGVAFLIASPISYLALEKWLDGFAYHISISFLAFILAGSITMILVFLTVSYQAIKVAVLNPTKTLRMD
ncbi:ABC transporter permease [Roseivirga sp.]|uniref:ABC transporter permease n=1 Tax=Roseivirga sp. TaxID=1964215 RepID=UPI003B525AC2